MLSWNILQYFVCVRVCVSRGATAIDGHKVKRFICFIINKKIKNKTNFMFLPWVMGNHQKIPVLAWTDQCKGKKSVVWEALFALYFFFFLTKWLSVWNWCYFSQHFTQFYNQNQNKQTTHFYHKKQFRYAAAHKIEMAVFQTQFTHYSSLNAPVITSDQVQWLYYIVCPHYLAEFMHSICLARQKTGKKKKKKRFCSNLIGNWVINASTLGEDLTLTSDSSAAPLSLSASSQEWRG